MKKTIDREWESKQNEFFELCKKDIVPQVLAVCMMTLKTRFGFGKKRLKKFYIHFMNGINSLIDRYDMDDEDAIWLCTHKLKEYGLTVADLQNEKLVEKDKR